MKKLFIILLLLFFAVSNTQNRTWIDSYTSNWEKFEGGTKLMANNDNWLPITFVLDYHPENLKADKLNGTYVVVPPRTKNYEVVRFDKIDKSKGWKFKKGNTRTYLGDLTDTEYDENYIYDLPFETNKSFKIGQGYNGNISHQNKFALDFDMPVNTKVLACRDGIVVQVVKKNSKRCNEPKCAEFNNLVKILHDDGTIMQYLHFRQNGVRVRLGQKVSKGQLIGLSGNVGWSTAPHLHVDLYLTDKNNKYKTLRTKFKINKNDIVDELNKGQTYLKGY
ncbi:M23 family metallopeptidase [uncultured Winogradskyella sp.]|uniref:M23 family metallopeptidase n=1 Tax=uncultured Winogradskyella sp. TaxID=395353 RepID=UPI0026301EDD|nr:M23 family metallopeptidase [uncultured Winogradskyella sp.]